MKGVMFLKLNMKMNCILLMLKSLLSAVPFPILLTEILDWASHDADPRFVFQSFRSHLKQQTYFPHGELVVCSYLYSTFCEDFL